MYTVANLLMFIIIIVHFYKVVNSGPPKSVTSLGLNFFLYEKRSWSTSSPGSLQTLILSLISLLTA